MAVIVTVGIDDGLVGVGRLPPPLETGVVPQPTRRTSGIKNKQKNAANGRRVHLEYLSRIAIS